MQEIGPIIRARREELGITQQTLAERLDITQSAVSQMEGRATINHARMPRVAAALDWTPGELAALVFTPTAEETT